MSRERLTAIVAQFSQAATSLLLALLAVRLLTPEDFGRYSLIIATLVVVTGITTGLIGDSLTVLDRKDPQIRAALQTAALVAVPVGGAAIVVVASLSQSFDGWALLIVFFAGSAFLFEDTARRLLMANRKFGSVVFTDAVYGVVGGCVLLAAVWTDQVNLGTIFLAMLLGQTSALVVALVLTPAEDRWLARGVTPAWRQMLSLGTWRSLNGAVGPLRFWSARMAVATLVGLAAVGDLEANRLIAAPVLLSIQGLSSAVLVHYAQRAKPHEVSRRELDRESAVFTLFAGVGALLMAALAGLLGPIIIGSEEQVDRLLVLGWTMTGVALAATMPYSNQAVVRGFAGRVLGIRATDLVVATVAIVALLLLAGPESYRWVPLLLAASTFVSLPFQRAVSQRPAAAATTANTVGQKEQEQ